MNTIPMVIKKSPDGERAMDICSRMLEDRIIFLTGEVNDSMAELIIAQLLYLDSISQEPISIYINSPGGSVTAGMAIYDAMRAVKSDVNTVCVGLAASMGAFLLSCGNHRVCGENAEVMIHQPLGGSQGQATEIEIAAKHILHTKKHLTTILAKNTGQDYDKVAADTERDNWLTAQDALDYGLVDEII